MPTAFSVITSRPSKPQNDIQRNLDRLAELRDRFAVAGRVSGIGGVAPAILRVAGRGAEKLAAHLITTPES